MDIRGNNPIVQTNFTADPAPVVFKDPKHSDRVFLYTSHDAPGSDWFTMDYLMCYSTTDMVNWTHHGAAMSWDDFKWAKKGTFWASQVIDRNGKFYAYVPIERVNGDGSDGPQIGVGISDSPYGPFTDAIGKPLISAVWDGDIDPTVYIDDDGQAYMYWGNPQLKYVKLKENMIETDGPVVRVPMTVESFGPRVGGPSEDGKYPTAYEEGPWLLKRSVEGLENPYYLVYAGGSLPEHIAYATAKTAEGPWVFGGTIMPSQEGTAFTIHPGLAEFQGHSYFFYHDQTLTSLEGFTGGFTRSVSVAEFKYGADGSIPDIPASPEGPPAIAALNPYVTTSAATINLAQDVSTERVNPNDKSDLRMHARFNKDGAFIRIKNADFKDGAAKMTANVTGVQAGDAALEIRINSISGPLAGVLTVADCFCEKNGREYTADVSVPAGVCELYFVFKGKTGAAVSVHSWIFNKGDLRKP